MKHKITALFIVAFLSACTPEVQTFEAAPHGDATLEDGVYRTEDGALLAYQSWVPKKKPRAVIVALHGFNDYSHAFEYPGEFFWSHGVALYAYDQRGFAKTANSGLWAGEENLVRDLKYFIEQVEALHPHVPVYILGESMGGAVVITAAAEPDFPKVNGIILSAPAVWGAETMNPIFRGTLWLAAHTIPARKLTGNDLKIIASSNYPMLVAMAYDPLIIKKTRVDAIYGMVRLMDSAYENIPAIHTPTLLLYGAKDQVIPRDPIKSALTRFSEPIVYAYYPKGYHMLLRDIDRAVVMEDMLSWIRHPDAPLPSGFGKMHDPQTDPPLMH